MDFKEHLLSLHWNTFAKYPAQGSDIYIHCYTDDGSNHKFFRVRQFNAVCFDFQSIVSKSSNKHQLRFSWLPVEKTEESYDTRNSD